MPVFDMRTARISGRSPPLPAGIRTSHRQLWQSCSRIKALAGSADTAGAKAVVFGHRQSRGRAAIQSSREHESGSRPARSHAPVRRQKVRISTPRRSGVVIGHAGCPPLPGDCGSRRCACCRPDPRRAASAPGSRSRGRAAILVNADLAPGPDELHQRPTCRRNRERSVVRSSVGEATGAVVSDGIRM